MVTHVRRQDNRPTYLLAQHNKNIVSYITWIKENPTIIELALI